MLCVKRQNPPRGAGGSVLVVCGWLDVSMDIVFASVLKQGLSDCAEEFHDVCSVLGVATSSYTGCAVRGVAAEAKVR